MNSSQNLSTQNAIDEQAWFAATRWQQLDGEYRANYLRILSVVAFYVIHAVQYYQLFGPSVLSTPVGRVFHVSATVIALIWLLAALAIDVTLRQRIFPAAMPFVTTAMDLILLTSVVYLGGGQQSPLILGYPVIQVFAAIRFDLLLVRWSTGGALVAYLYLMAAGRWPELFGGRTIGLVPRYSQLMTLLAMVVVGIALGQLIRRFRGMAEYYARRCSAGASDVQ